MLVPEPVLVALNTSEPEAMATALTVSSVVGAAMSPVRSALMVAFWLTLRYTPSSVLVPSPGLVMVMLYGPPTRRPRAL